MAVIVGGVLGGLGAVLVARGIGARRRQLAEAQTAALQQGAAVSITCLVRGSAPGFPSGWRRGTLLLGPAGATWSPARGSTPVLDVPLGARLVSVGRPDVGVTSPKANVFEVARWAEGEDWFETAVPKEQVRLVVKVLGGTGPGAC